MLQEVPPGQGLMPEAMRISIAEAELLAADVFQTYAPLRALRELAANPTMEQVTQVLNRFLREENLGFEQVPNGSLGLDNLASLTERPGVLQMTPDAFASPRVLLHEVAHEMGATYTSRYMREQLGWGRSELLWTPEVLLEVSPQFARRWLNHYVDDITGGVTRPP
jgi:hypothetical protein